MPSAPDSGSLAPPSAPPPPISGRADGRLRAAGSCTRNPGGTAGSTWPAPIGSAGARLARHALPLANSAARVSARAVAPAVPSETAPSIGSCAVPTASTVPCEGRGAAWERVRPGPAAGQGLRHPQLLAQTGAGRERGVSTRNPAHSRPHDSGAWDMPRWLGVWKRSKLSA